MKRLYILCAVALLLLGVTSSAGVIQIPSAQASGMSLVVASGSTPPADPGGGSLQDSNTEASAGFYEVGRYSTTLYVGGNYTTSSAYTLSSVKVYLSRVDPATGTLTAHIYATSSGAPTGSALASSGTVNRADVPTSETAVEFTGFSLALNTGTEYCIIISANEVNGDETIRVHYSAGGGTYTNETYIDDDGVPAFAANQDEVLKFEAYGS